MKALLAAFTLLSFLAASTVPMIASAEEMNQGGGDQTMSKTDNKAPSNDKSGKTKTSTKHAKSHKTAHKKTTHKKTSKKKTHKKHSAKKKTAPKDTGKTTPPKAG
ncbi:MAG TPA: hypothetical protein VID77_10765 [Stellaceae bacterium]